MSELSLDTQNELDRLQFHFSNTVNLPALRQPPKKYYERGPTSEALHVQQEIAKFEHRLGSEIMDDPIESTVLEAPPCTEVDFYGCNERWGKATTLEPIFLPRRRPETSGRPIEIDSRPLRERQLETNRIFCRETRERSARFKDTQRKRADVKRSRIQDFRISVQGALRVKRAQREQRSREIGELFATGGLQQRAPVFDRSVPGGISARSSHATSDRDIFSSSTASQSPSHRTPHGEPPASSSSVLPQSPGSASQRRRKRAQLCTPPDARAQSSHRSQRVRGPTASTYERMEARRAVEYQRRSIEEFEMLLLQLRTAEKRNEAQLEAEAARSNAS